MKKSSDYYFYVGNGQLNNRGILCAICDINFFDKNGYLEDHYILLDGILPFFLSQNGPGIFNLNRKYTLDQVDSFMEAFGFTKSEKFTEFCRTHDPFVE